MTLRLVVAFAHQGASVVECGRADLLVAVLSREDPACLNGPARIDFEEVALGKVLAEVEDFERGWRWQGGRI